jgi:putative flippase GtrA
VSIRTACSNSLSSSLDSAPAGLGAHISFAEEAADASSTSSERNSDSAASAGVALLVPAFRPGNGLVDLVKAFYATGSNPKWDVIVVVDDGSGPAYANVFDEISRIPGVQVVPHAVNLGKGAALKSGINFILCAYPGIAGVVTADADGQHDPADIVRVRDRLRQNPNALILGVRAFDGRIPLRSKFGNRITRGVMRAVLGQKVADSQTGLRAIPRHLLARLLKISASGYEFESEMLVAVKHLGVSVVEQPIRTIYELHNPSSHFQPVWDSIRIYSVLLRFGFISILTAALDNGVFYLLFGATGNIAVSQIGARLAAVLLNYSAVRKAVFLSDEKHRLLLPRYLLVVLVNGLLSYAGIRLLTSATPAGVVPAKMLAEALLFIVNFLAQRDFVFSKRSTAPGATNWDQYYKRMPFLARFTRRYTERVLISALRRCSFSRNETILEIGGANSCFLNGLTRALRPRAYHVVDRNEYGLALLARRTAGQTGIVLHRGNVLAMEDLGLKPDIVFSVGLIEHFTPEDTRRAIQAHFDCLKEGGYALISFPTPTWLYRTVRCAAEALGLWQFPDERPLSPREVRRTANTFGKVIFEKTLWPLVLTQYLLVVQKREDVNARG